MNNPKINKPINFQVIKNIQKVKQKTNEIIPKTKTIKKVISNPQITYLNKTNFKKFENKTIPERIEKINTKK
jgi:hypothetical protein